MHQAKFPWWLLLRVNLLQISTFFGVCYYLLRCRNDFWWVRRNADFIFLGRESGLTVIV
jgi:hypothetical protein